MPWFLTLLFFLLEAGEGQLLPGKVLPYLLQSWDFLRGSHLLSSDTVFLTSCLQIVIWRVDTWKKNHRSTWTRRRQRRGEAGDCSPPPHMCRALQSQPQACSSDPPHLLPQLPTSEVRSNFYLYLLLAWPHLTFPSRMLLRCTLGNQEQVLSTGPGRRQSVATFVSNQGW